LLVISIKTAYANVIFHDVVIVDSNPGSLQLSAMGHDIKLQLKQSRFNRLLYLQADTQTKKQHIPPLLYEGYVTGDKNSWARITFDNGKPFGYLFYNGKLLQLDSRSRIKELIASSWQYNWQDNWQDRQQDDLQDNALVLIETASHGAAQQLLQTFSYKVDTLKFAPAPKSLTAPANKNALALSKETFSNEALNRDAFGTNVTRTIRIGIAVDSRFNEAHQQRGLARALSIINSVDAIYQSQLGIAILVEAISVYEDPNTDPMRYFEGTVDQLLSNFRPVRIDDPKLPADLSLVHLFSGHRDPDRVIGLGWINTACRLDGYDVSMSTPFPFDTLLAAHEIAHNLGALHDDHQQCHMDSSRSTSTLMWPRLSSDTTAEFSACSIRSVQAGKNASCNMDNIDVAISMNAYPTSEALRRSLVIHAQNNDSLQRTSQLTSITNFPEGTTFTDISAGCRIDGKSAYCNHGSVKAGDTQTMSVTATLPNHSQEDVISEIVPINSSDVQTNDNRAVIKLLQFDSSTGEAVAGDSAFLNDLETTPNDGIGSFSLGFLLSLLFTQISILISTQISLQIRTHQARRFTA